MKKVILSKIFIIITTPLVMFCAANQHVSANTAMLQLKHEDYVEDTVTVNVYLDTMGSTVHAVTANFTYPEELMDAQEASAEETFSSVIDMDISKKGTVYFSAVSQDGFRGQENIASVKFKLLKTGTADLAFMDDVAVIDKESSQNIVGETEIAQYDIDSLENLPDTGIKEAVISFYGLLMLVAMIMIIVFAILGFSMWGTIYFSIGKFEIKGAYQVGSRSEKTSVTKKRSLSKKPKKR